MKTKSYFTRIVFASLAAIYMAAVAHASTWDQKLADGAYQIIIGDWNGDQHSDVLWQAKRPEDEHAALFTAVSNANTQRWKDGHLSYRWSRHDTNMVVGDFNGDLNGDILLQSTTPAFSSELIITKANGYIGVPTQSIGDWHLGLRWDSNNSRLIVGDYDGDGHDDIFLHGKNNNRHGLALADKNGQFGTLAFDFDNNLYDLDWSDKNATLNAGDFDGDGKYELLLQPTKSDGKVALIGGDYKQGALATVTQQWPSNYLDLDWSSQRHRIIVGDFNGDGKDDVFLLATTKDDSSVYLPFGEQSFDHTQERIDAIPNLEKLIDIIVADFDADGIDELLLVFDDKNTPISLLLADGARRTRIEGMLKSNGLLTAEQQLISISSASVASEGDISTATASTTLTTLQQCSPTDENCAPDPCEVEPDSPECNEAPPQSGSVGIKQIKSSTGVGITSTEFRVDEGGNATFSVPITITKGSGGFSPVLALNYNSQSGNGLLGMGWNVSGLSSVSRCRKSFEVDGVDGIINFDGNDAFCLDGQRLILEDVAARRYRTEPNSNIEIFSFGNTIDAPERFEVSHKDGTKVVYGGADDSKVEINNINNGTVVATSKILRWTVSEISDLNKNRISFHYTEDTMTGDHRIAYINYTERENQSAFAKVEFEYESRADTASVYAFGGKTLVSKRLAAIHNYENGVNLHSYNLIYANQSQYESSRIVAIQECATLGSEQCLPPMKFNWQHASTGFSANSTNVGTLDTDIKAMKSGDVNGDGLMDFFLVYKVGNDRYIKPVINNGRSFNQPASGTLGVRIGHASENAWQVVDFNGDGRSDILAPICSNYAYNDEIGFSYCTSWGSWGVYLANADGTLRSEGFNTTIPIVDPNQVEFADFDGNGLGDLFYQEGTQFKVAFLGRALVDGHVCGATGLLHLYCFAPPQTVSVNLPQGQTNANGTGVSAEIIEKFSDKKNRVIFDVNGDAFADLLINVKYTVTRLSVPRGTSTYTVPETKKRILIAKITRSSSNGKLLSFDVLPGVKPVLDQMDVDFKWSHVVDINGDGLSDLLFKNTGGSWNTFLNNGVSFSVGSSLGAINEGDRLQFADYNADGYTDLLYPQSGKRFVRLQNPNGDFSTGSASALISDGGMEELIDVNGDGHVDQWRVSGNNQYVQEGALSQKPWNVINELINGFGAKTAIVYQPMTMASVYTRSELGPWQCSYDDATASYDTTPLCGSWRWGKGSAVFDVVMPSYMVSQVSSSAPAANENTAANIDKNAMAIMRYFYHGLKIQAGGRGALGFEQIASIDYQSNVQTVTSFRQDYPYIGMPVVTTKSYLGDRTVLPPNPCQDNDCRPPPCKVGDSCTAPLFLSTTTSGAQKASYSAGTNNLPWGSLYSAAPARLSIAINTLAKQEQIRGGYMPYVRQSDESSFELTGVRLAGVKSRFVYDLYGNAASVIIEQQNGSGNMLQRKSTTSVYGATASQPVEMKGKYFGRLSNVTVLTERNVGSSVTRSSAFDYWPDTLQLKSETVEPSGNQQEYLRTSHTYDSYGNRDGSVVQSCHAVGGVPTCSGAANSSNPYYINRSSHVEYDARFPVNDPLRRGRYADKQINAYGQTVGSVSERDAFGRVKKSSDIHGVVTVTAFSPFGQLESQTQRYSGGDVTSWSVSSSNNWQMCNASICSEVNGAAYKLTTTLSTGSVSTVFFDLLGREIYKSSTGFNGTPIVSLIEYDIFSRVKRSTAPHFSGASAYWTTNSYDLLGRIKAVSLPSENEAGNVEYVTESVTYNDNEFKLTKTNARGYATTEYRNALGELIRVQDARGGNVLYQYNVMGQLEKLSRVTNNTSFDLNEPEQSVLEYDRLGRKTRMWDADKSPSASKTTGGWSYDYNALGELVKQTDARGYTTENWYDAAGRVTRRLEIGAGETLSDVSWSFNNTTSSGGARAQLESEYDAVSRYRRVPGYFSDGKIKSTQHTIDYGQSSAASFTESVSYDTSGRAYIATDVSGQSVQTEFNAYGYAYKIRNANNAAQVFQLIQNMNAFGAVTQEQAGGVVTTERGYGAGSGRLRSIRSTKGVTQLQALTYHWDAVGNLKYRIDASMGKNLREDFVNDELNRLTSALVQKAGVAQVTQSVGYNGEGNIISKTGISGTYTYGSNSDCATAGPHAVTRANGQVYCYDANGNQLSGDGRNVVYKTAFDLPTFIDTSRHDTWFTYAPNHSRLKRVDQNGSGRSTVYTLGNVEIVINRSKTEYRRNLPNATINNGEVSYILRDHLGSTDVIVDCAGNFKNSFSFDAWGKQRDNNWISWGHYSQWQSGALFSPMSGNKTIHGFTGHEHLDEVGLIHMNGRVYEPNLGRFMQADPYIQAPSNSQSLNRYSYVFNNPLSLTDPSGFISWGRILRRTARHHAHNTLWQAHGMMPHIKFSDGQYHPAKDVVRAIMGQMHPKDVQGAVTIGSYFCGPFYALCVGAGSYDNARAHGAGHDSALKYGVAMGLMSYTAQAAWGLAAQGHYFASAAVAYSGAYASAEMVGGSGSDAGRIAVLQLALKVAMDKFVSWYTQKDYNSTMDGGAGDAVVKAKGSGVYDSNLDNTGSAVVVPVNGETSRLIGLRIKDLSADQVNIILKYNPEMGSIIGVDSLNQTWWSATSEASKYMSGVSRGLPGARAFSVFHDVWMDAWKITDQSAIMITIFPSAVWQYRAFGLMTNDYMAGRW